MALHLRVIGAVALGVGAYALYKTGFFKPVAKKAIETGMTVSSWAKDKAECAKEKYASLKNEVKKEKAEKDKAEIPQEAEA